MTEAMNRVAELERSAIAGEEVSASELAAAREEARIAELAARGRREREAADSARRQQEAVEQAKRDVAALLGGGVTEVLLPQYDAAVRALTDLMAAAEAWNEKLQSAAQQFDQAGIPSRSVFHAAPEDLDKRNYVYWDGGYQVQSLTVDGNGHVPAQPAQWVLAAIRETARKTGGLSMNYHPNIENQLRGDDPSQIRDRA